MTGGGSRPDIGTWLFIALAVAGLMFAQWLTRSPDYCRHAEDPAECQEEVEGMHSFRGIPL